MEIGKADGVAAKPSVGAEEPRGLGKARLCLRQARRGLRLVGGAALHRPEEALPDQLPTRHERAWESTIAITWSMRARACGAVGCRVGPGRKAGSLRKGWRAKW